MSRRWQSIKNRGLLLWQSVKNRGLLLLFIAFVTVIGIVFFAILRTDPNLATATVAFGTLLLAIVTAISIDNSRAIARRRREEELAKEKRDRQEQLLNEIIKWAINVSKCGLRKLSPGPLEIRDFSEAHIIYMESVKDLTLMFEAVKRESKYISSIALQFEPSLKNVIDNLIAVVGNHILFLDAYSNAIPGAFARAGVDMNTLTLLLKPCIDNVANNKTKLDSLADNIIEEATSIKIALLNH